MQCLMHGSRASLDLGRVLLEPGTGFRFGHRLQFDQPVGGRQHTIDLRRVQRLTSLGGHKTILHGMGQVHDGIQPHDPRGSFYGVRRAHQVLQPGRRCSFALQKHQLVLQNVHLLLRFHTEQIVERGIFEAAAGRGSHFCRSGGRGR